MQRSYSHKGYPYDNACIESFHALIKREWPDRFKITDFRHAYRLVFEYIEAFYNTVRIHSHCDYMSPDQFHSLPNIVYHSFQNAFPYFASVYFHIGLHLPSTIRVEQTFVAQLFFSIWSFPLLRDCFAVLYNVFIITSRIGVARCFCTVLISRWNGYGFTNCTANPLV